MATAKTAFSFTLPSSTSGFQFSHDFHDPRTYTIRNETIPEEGIDSVIFGSNKSDKTNSGVEEIFFNNCVITRVPQGLTKTFPNLQSLRILNSKLKVVKNEDLIEYKHFKSIILDKNLIEFLPADLFKGFENLEKISFRGNPLKLIEPSILDNFENEKLKYADFSENPNYNTCYNLSVFFSASSLTPNQPLAEVKNKLFEKYYAHVNGLQEKNKQLEAENEAMKQQIEDLNVLKVTPESFESEMKSFTQTNVDLKDFTIKIDNEEFLVHKLVIAARSPTLADIFRNNSEAECLNLTDISVEIFEKMLKYFYNDELPDDNDVDFMELFAASGRLQVQRLKNFSAEKLIPQINAENALKVLKMSNKYEHENLKEAAFNEIKKMYPEFEFEDKWSTNVEKLENALEILNEKERLIKELDAKLKVLKE